MPPAVVLWLVLRRFYDFLIDDESSLHCHLSPTAKDKVCFECKKPGHVSQDCPIKPSKLLKRTLHLGTQYRDCMVAYWHTKYVLWHMLLCDLLNSVHKGLVGLRKLSQFSSVNRKGKCAIRHDMCWVSLYYFSIYGFAVYYSKHYAKMFCLSLITDDFTNTCVTIKNSNWSVGTTGWIIKNKNIEIIRLVYTWKIGGYISFAKKFFWLEPTVYELQFSHMFKWSIWGFSSTL